MSAGAKTCPKCAGRMEEGFTVDAGDYNMPSVGVWHRGEPKRSFWGLKTVKADKIDIVSWRCIRCFYLEHYAP